jgi:DNA-binding GntR family transcriptional regulator
LELRIVSTNKKADTGSLSRQAYDALKDMIRRRELRGNEIVREAPICEILNVSRTPLREALQRLEGEGLVVKASNRAFIVRRVELAEYLNSINVRIILEVEAVRLAFDHIQQTQIDEVRAEIMALSEAKEFSREAHWRSDNSVHGLVADNCRNPVLANMIRSLRVTTNLFEIEQVADRIEPDSTEHLGLLDALQSGPVARATRAMRAHLGSLRKSATRHLLRDPGNGKQRQST